MKREIKKLGGHENKKQRSHLNPYQTKLLPKLKLRQIRLTRLHQDKAEGPSIKKTNDQKLSRHRFKMMHGFNGVFLGEDSSCPRKMTSSLSSLPTNKAYRLRHEINANLVKSLSAQDLSWKIGTKNWESSTKVETTKQKSLSLAWQSTDLRSRSKSPLKKLSPYMQPLMHKGRVQG